jgi:hypothetical protein
MHSLQNRGSQHFCPLTLNQHLAAPRTCLPLRSACATATPALCPMIISCGSSLRVQRDMRICSVVLKFMIVQLRWWQECHERGRRRARAAAAQPEGAVAHVRGAERNTRQDLHAFKCDALRSAVCSCACGGASGINFDGMRAACRCRCLQRDSHCLIASEGAAEHGTESALLIQVTRHKAAHAAWVKTLQPTARDCDAVCQLQRHSQHKSRSKIIVNHLLAPHTARSHPRSSQSP